MDWANETYVRLYVRDTTTWLLLGWDGQCVLMQLMRKLDMAGVMDIGELQPWEAVVVHCGAPEEAARRGMQAVLKHGVLEHNGQHLVAPNFREAQEATKSDKQRQRESRERRRTTAVTKRDAGITNRDHVSRDVMDPSRPVTSGHERSRLVTHCNAVRCSALRETRARGVTKRDTQPSDEEPPSSAARQEFSEGYRALCHEQGWTPVTLSAKQTADAIGRARDVAQAHGCSLLEASRRLMARAHEAAADGDVYLALRKCPVPKPAAPCVDPFAAAREAATRG